MNPLKMETNHSDGARFGVRIHLFFCLAIVILQTIRRRSRMPSDGAPEASKTPPVIRKAGSYTIFLTPQESPMKRYEAPNPIAGFSSKVSSPLSAEIAPPPPVQAPPAEFEKHGGRNPASAFGFFWDAVAKVQNAHSRLDVFVSEWFGLDKSRYQWALDDYYESNGMHTIQLKLNSEELCCRRRIKEIGAKQAYNI